MTSEQSPVQPTIIYASAKRVVVKGENIVLQIERDITTGWFRTIGAGGPLSGELLNKLEDGRWSREPNQFEQRLIELALKEPVN